MITHGRTEFQRSPTNNEKYANATRLPYISKTRKSASTPDVQPHVNETRKLQHFSRQQSSNSFILQFENKIADSENLKTKMLDLEDQKAQDFPWWTVTPTERIPHRSAHEAAPEHEPAHSAHLDSNRPKRPTWDEIETLLRREDCALLEYDLRDASGGAACAAHTHHTPRARAPDHVPAQLARHRPHGCSVTGRRRRRRRGGAQGGAGRRWSSGCGWYRGMESCSTIDR
jgi:hypothetical protein